MSWDVSLEFDKCDHCEKTQESVEVRNVTYNNSKIFTRLGVHPSQLDGLVAKDVVPRLKRALELSQQIEAELVTMEPPNKWGGLSDSRHFIERLLVCCETNPDGRISVH